MWRKNTGALFSYSKQQGLRINIETAAADCLTSVGKHPYFGM